MHRAAVVAGCSESSSGHREQEGVVFEVASGGAPEGLQGVPEGGERFGRDVEVEDMAARGLGIAGLRWQLAGAFAGDEAFELARGLAVCGVEPSGLCLWRADAGELARGAPVQRALCERSSGARQALQRFGDTQLLTSGAR